MEPMTAIEVLRKKAEDLRRLLVTLTDMVAQAEVELENSRLHVQDVMRALADCERALKILEAPPG